MKNEKKDISKCYGLLKDYPEGIAIIKAEAEKARKQTWREIII